MKIDIGKVYDDYGKNELYEDLLSIAVQVKQGSRKGLLETGHKWELEGV